MATTLADLQAELAEVKTALSNIRTAGQSYNRPGFSYQQANYDSLVKHKNLLEKQIRQMDSSGTGSSNVDDFSGGSSGSNESDEWGDD